MQRPPDLFQADRLLDRQPSRRFRDEIDRIPVTKPERPTNVVSSDYVGAPMIVGYHGRREYDLCGLSVPEEAAADPRQ